MSISGCYLTKVVILCGGQGTRLREETEFKPKPLVEIGGLPILWHIMKHYDANGYNEFVLCLGYRGNMIKEFFMHYEWDVFDFSLNLRDKKHLYHRTHEVENWTITFAETGEKTLTGSRVKAIEKYIPQDDKYFMLTYGDGVSDIDIKALIKFHERTGKLATLTGVYPRGKYGIIEVNEKNEITNFIEKPPSDDFINGGFMVMNRDVFDLIPGDTDQCILELDFLPLLAKQGQLAIYPHRGFWHSMDTHKEFLDLNRMWDEGAPWKTWDDHPKRRK